MIDRPHSEDGHRNRRDKATINRLKMYKSGGKVEHIVLGCVPVCALDLSLGFSLGVSCARSVGCLLHVLFSRLIFA